MRNQAGPTNPGHDVGGSSNNSSAGEAAHGEAGSPWDHGAGATHTNLMEATATTAILPAIGGANDPYAQREAPTAARRDAPGAVAPAPPMSAVDQYAALAGAGAAPGLASAAPAKAVGSAARGLPPVAPVAPPVVGGVGGVGGVGVGGVGALASKVRPAKAIRAPKSARSPRRAKLQLRHINVWSVLRFSCVLAIALFFVWLIMVGVLYGLLDVTHVFDKVNDTVRQINGDSNSKNVVTPGIVFAGAFIIGLVNIVLFIALSTIGSIVYNLCADLVGGIEVTFAEHE